MVTKIKCLCTLLAVAMLIEACGGGAPATEAPAATEAPVETQAPVATEPPVETEAPVATESPIPTEAPTQPAEVQSPVVILVVDNFSVNKEPEDDSTGICTVLPDGFGVYHGTEMGRTINGIAHGVFVYNEVMKQLRSEGFSSLHGVESITPRPDMLHANFDGLPDWAWRVDRWQKSEVGEIIVVAVDTQGLQSDQIFANMAAALDTFTQGVVVDNVSLPPIKWLVVNMSFGFVPCEPILYIRQPLLVAEGLIPNLCSEKPCNDINSVSELRAVYNAPDGQGNKTSNLYKYINDPASFQVDIDQSWKDTVPILQERVKAYHPGPPNESEDALFEAFITHLVYSPDDLKLDNEAHLRFLSENLTDPSTSGDGWLKQLEDQFNELVAQYPQAVFVGAAGNSGLSYPFFPAVSDSVTSVSSDGDIARSPCQGTVATDSNCAEVKMEGAYLGNPTTTATSFAAPKFSFKVAYHLLLGSNCPVDTYNYSSESSNGPWDNLPYDACSP